jgi:hypothetical protein
MVNQHNSSIKFIDLFLDAIHNFHPQYRDYTQYSAQVRFLVFKNEK